MAAEPTEDAWMEKCLISIAKQGGSNMNFSGFTETVSVEFGDKDIEAIALVNGGRVVKWSPEDITTITMEGYPLQAGTLNSATSATTGTGVHDLMHTADTAVPLSYTHDHNRDKHRVALMWTNDTSVTSAAGSTVTDKSAIRFVFAEAYCTSIKPEFTGDKILKYTWTFKVAPFDKSANANIKEESAAGTSGSDKLSALAAYTTSTKW